MTILPNEEIITDDEVEYKDMPPLTEEAEEEEMPVNEQVGLVVRRALTTHVKETDNLQREISSTTDAILKAKCVA